MFQSLCEKTADTGYSPGHRLVQKKAKEGLPTEKPRTGIDLLEGPLMVESRGTVLLLAPALRPQLC